MNCPPQNDGEEQEVEYWVLLQTVDKNKELPIESANNRSSNDNDSGASMTPPMMPSRPRPAVIIIYLLSTGREQNTARNSFRYAIINVGQRNLECGK